MVSGASARAELIVPPQPSPSALSTLRISPGVASVSETLPPCLSGLSADPLCRRGWVETPLAAVLSCSRLLPVQSFCHCCLCSLLSFLTARMILCREQTWCSLLPRRALALKTETVTLKSHLTPPGPVRLTWAGTEQHSTACACSLSLVPGPAAVIALERQLMAGSHGEGVL